MGRTIHLNGAVPLEERDIVELFDKTYRLKPITRSVQKQMHAIQKKSQDLAQRAQEDDAFDEEAGLDEEVGYFIELIDLLLEIDGGHRTSAKKLLMGKWESDEITFPQIQSYLEQLQQDEVEARPT
jgi:hypothetical protein